MLSSHESPPSPLESASSAAMASASGPSFEMMLLQDSRRNSSSQHSLNDVPSTAATTTEYLSVNDLGPGHYRRPSFSTAPASQEPRPPPESQPPWSEVYIRPRRNGTASTRNYATAPSNQLEKRGKLEDATTQVDSRYFFDVLPSERRLMEHEAYPARTAITTARPYNGPERSVTVEMQEMSRVSNHPTLRELRTLTRYSVSTNLSSFKFMLGKKARQRRKEKRSQLGFWGRRKDDLSVMWDEVQMFSKKYLISVWTAQKRTIEQSFGNAYACYFDYSRLLLYLNIVLVIMSVCLIIAEGLADRNWSESNIDYIPYFPLNTSTHASFFYYSGYQKKMLDNTYDMDMAYFCCVCLVFIISFFVIVKSLRDQLMLQFDVSGGSASDDHRWLSTLFSRFDYTIVSEQGVQSMRRAITNQFQTMLDEEEIAERDRQLYSGKNLLKIIARRVLGNLVVFVLLGVMGFLIYYFTVNYPTVVTPYGSLRPTSLLVSCLTVVLPFIFSYVGQFEKYSTDIIESISRNWETNIGQDFYDLIWINGVMTIVTVLGTAWLEELWTWFTSKGKDSRGYIFSLSDNILQLIYCQCLVWIGVVYCPVAPIVSIIFSLIIFYVHYFTLQRYGKHPEQLLSAIEFDTFFFKLLLFTLIVCAIPVAYALTTMTPSTGPWFGLAYAYEVMPYYISQTPLAVQTTMAFLMSATFLVPTLVLLLMLLYFLHSYNHQRKLRIDSLEQDLVAEREDKRYLLRFYRVQI